MNITNISYSYIKRYGNLKWYFI